MSSAKTLIISDLDGRKRRKMRAYTLGDRSSGEQHLVRQPRYRIGSHQSNDLVLAHASVSRFHLELEVTPLGQRVRDLESTNGTFVGEVRVKEAYLPAETDLRLGKITLHFRLGDDTADLPASDDDSFQGVVGQSPAMRELFAQMKRVAPTKATVLLHGESGTGKELAAAALHRASGRSGPFVVLDCAAIPQSLMESELFGHERGAFTGAADSREGRFEQADGGTLFLDEIGELPLELQPKLLRVLEQREVRRLGSDKTRGCDVRVVCATNRDLAREVNRGSFREDLYFRLAVIELRLPALRERIEDIRPLVTLFVQQLLAEEPQRAEQVLRGISQQNWSKLEQLPWNGNVRELRNFIERTLILTDRPVTSSVIPAPGALGPGSQRPGSTPVDLDRPFGEQKTELIARFERDYLFGLLARHDHNISAAARAAGLDRMNYKRLLKKYR